ncbi:hypothetical protein VA7868_02398 [Vibrio aerogenes CECT 7868]|uniref:DUF4123 domain-containing protein n=1 Tax=Vibrio aerogenes CECT 7868 TaxID=1216006 RepID=A0A1M5Z7D7_9VIBR|nr:DUF4123 domain-containing protein [Vibrio aerogenes]SHI20149.1 hypothetical protein VA7868_02398 [Vibrio aerogenes CECT 7868]
MMYQFDPVIPEIKTTDTETLYLFIDGAQLTDLSQLPSDIPPLPVYCYLVYEELNQISPYLFHATPEIKQWFIGQNKPTAGFFFSSYWSAEELVQHFHQLIQVNSPYNTQSFLKMAHSEVAWALLKTKCQLFWEPMEKAWLPTRMGWKVLTHPDDKRKESPEAPLNLDEEQWMLFDEITWRNLLEKIHRHVGHHFPGMLNQEFFDLWIDAHARIAHQKGFATAGDQLRYFNIIGLLGEQSVTSEMYPDIYQLVHFTSKETPAERIKKAEKLALQYAEPETSRHFYVT